MMIKRAGLVLLAGVAFGCSNGVGVTTQRLDTGGGDCDADGQCPPPIIGTGTISTVIESFTHAGQPVAISSVTAGFSLVTTTVPGGCAATTTMGQCRLYDCPIPVRRTPVIPPARSAGTLTFDGAAVPIALAPDAHDLYGYYDNQSALVWSGGDTLTVTASGADVPPFQLSAVAPSLVTMTAPETPNARLTLDRTQDLTVSWSGGVTGTVQLALDANTATRLTEIVCEAPAAEGSVVVPQAALATLLAAPTTRWWSLTNIANVQQQVGGYLLYWNLASFGGGSDGNIADGKLSY